MSGRVNRQYDVSVGLSCAFSFSSLAMFFLLAMHATLSKHRLLGMSRCPAKTTLTRRRRKYKTPLSPSQGLPLLQVVNFSSVFMASYLKIADHSGTRILVSKKLEQTKVLKTVSSIFNKLLQQSGIKTCPIIGEHFVTIFATQSITMAFLNLY